MRRPALIFLFCLALASCSRAVDKYVIGISQCSIDMWREVANSEMMQEASFYSDISLVIRSVHDDSEQQIRDIERFIDDKVDLLVISPNEAESLTPVVEKAYDAGIPVILYDRKINSDKYTAFVGGDNHQIGVFAGMYVLSRLQNGGNIILIQGTKGSTADTERYDGFVEATRESTSINVTARAYANFNRSDARRVMTELLETLPDQKKPDLVFAFNDEMAAGVYEAYAQAGIKDRPYILGIDALLSTDDSGTISYIQDGIVDASFIYPTGGNVVIDLARRILMNAQYNKENILNTDLVNRSNAKIYSMQLSQIAQKQKRVEELNSRINASLAKYERQQILSYGLLALSIVLGVMFISLVFVTHARNKLVNQLNIQNARIKKQVDSLEAQKQQLVELSQKLEETTAAKLVFFTNISHEFKTPLSLISGPIDDLIVNKEMPQSAAVPLDILKRNSSKLTRLITELLDFRTLESGKMVVNYSIGHIDDFIRRLSPCLPMWSRKESFTSLSRWMMPIIISHSIPLRWRRYSPTCCPMRSTMWTARELSGSASSRIPQTASEQSISPCSTAARISRQRIWTRSSSASIRLMHSRKARESDSRSSAQSSMPSVLRLMSRAKRPQVQSSPSSSQS